MIVLYRLFLASLVSEALFALFHEKSFSVQDGATNVNAIALYKNSILHTSSNDVLEKDIETGFLLRTFRAHSNLITTFVVSEDFRMITSGFDNMIVVWDLETGSVIRRIPLGAADTRISHISLLNDQLFTGGLDWIVRQVNLKSGRVRSIDMGGSVSSIAADNEFLYVGNTRDGFVISRIEIISSRLSSTLIGHSDTVTTLLVYGSFLFSGSGDNSIIRWDLDTEKIIKRFIGHSRLISSLIVINGDLYSGAYDSDIIMWNINTGEMIAKFPPIHFNFVKCLTGRDQSLFSGYSFYKNRNKKIRSIALWKSVVLSGGEDFTVQLWDTSVKTVDPLAVLTGHTFPVNAISIYNDYLFSGSSDRTIRQRSLLSRSYLKEFIGHTLGIATIDVRNSHLYSGSFDLSIKKWDITSGNTITEYIGHTGDITHITVAPGYIFSGGFDRTVLMWDEESSKIERSFQAINVVFAVFVDNEYVFAAIATGFTRFLLTSPEEYLFYDDYVASYCIALSETRLYTGHHDGLIRRRDPLTLSMLETFQGHTDSVLSFCLDFAGILFSGGADGSIKKWNIATRTVAFSFEDRGWSVSALSALDNLLLVGLMNGFLGFYTIDNAYLTTSGFVHEKEISALLVQDNVLFSSSLDGIIRSYSFQTREAATFYDVKQTPIRNLAVNKYNFVILKGEQEIGFIQTNLSGRLYFSLSSPLPLLCLAVSESIVTAGARSGAVLVWDIETKLFLFDLKGHSAQVNSLLIKDDKVYSASDDKVIIEWSISNQVISRKFQRLSASSLGHIGPVNSLSICGNALFSGGSDIVTRRWNLIKGNHEDVYFGPSKQITAVLCHNWTVFSGSEDYSVLMYRPTFVEELTPTSTSLKVSAPSNSRRPVRIVSSLKSNIGPNSVLQGVVVGVTLVLVFFALIVVLLRRKQLKHNRLTDSIAFTTRTDTSQTVTDLKTVINTVIGISKHAAYLMETSAFSSTKKIAVGGGGELYLSGVMDPALRKKIGKTVIQKIVFVKNDAAREAFYQEVGIMIMLLPFPYFCRILGYTENPVSIILEYYPDGSLNEWLKPRKRSKSIMLKMFKEISQGLEIMHSHFLAHCDLKPQNILVKVAEGIPCFFITDFGITQVISESIIAAKSFNIINLRGLSVHYAAPEAFTSFRTKKYSRIDFKMFDVFSFGCLTYEVQSGKMPWH